MEKRCPSHPQDETMVPCLSCGRYFCRICNPQGGGQYCPQCFEEQLSRLSSKDLTSRGKGREAFKEKVKPRAGIGEFFHKKIISRIFAIFAFFRSLPAKIWRLLFNFWRYLIVHFPFTLRETERSEGGLDIAQYWKKFVLFCAGGIVLWVILVSVTHVRHPLFSVLVAIVITGCTAWAFGPRFGMDVAFIATCLSAVTLMVGEVIVQLLVRLGLLKKLDVIRLPAVMIQKQSEIVYKSFYYKLFVHRLIPSLIASFLVGLWPLKKRIGWKGFTSRESE